VTLLTHLAQPILARAGADAVWGGIQVVLANFEIEFYSREGLRVKNNSSTVSAQYSLRLLVAVSCGRDAALKTDVLQRKERER
jgi:hypothetical protein